MKRVQILIFILLAGCSSNPKKAEKNEDDKKEFRNPASRVWDFQPMLGRP